MPVGQDLESIAGGIDTLLQNFRGFNISQNNKPSIARKRIAAEFAKYYGSDVSKRERWQEICRDCGLSSIPPSINKCKKV